MTHVPSQSANESTPGDRPSCGLASAAVMFAALAVACAGPPESTTAADPELEDAPECVADADCGSDDLCLGGVCYDASCADNFISGDESDIDCGGSCLPCSLGALCVVADDCSSGLCNESGRCDACTSDEQCEGEDNVCVEAQCTVVVESSDPGDEPPPVVEDPQDPPPPPPPPPVSQVTCYGGGDVLIFGVDMGDFPTLSHSGTIAETRIGCGNGGEPFANAAPYNGIQLFCDAQGNWSIGEDSSCEPTITCQGGGSIYYGSVRIGTYPTKNNLTATTEEHRVNCSNGFVNAEPYNGIQVFCHANGSWTTGSDSSCAPQ